MPLSEPDCMAPAAATPGAARQPAAAPAPRVLVPLHIDPRPPAFGGRRHRLGGATMGTRWQVDLIGPAAADAEDWRVLVEAELALVVRQMSTWQADSDLSRFNALPAGGALVLPEAFDTVLRCALAVAEASGGAFDPAAGAWVDLWGFGPAAHFADQHFTPPSAEAIARSGPGAPWQRLAYDAAARRLVQPGGLRLDLSAIAKGHAVDRVARRLAGAGVESLLVDIGGELRGEGLKTDGQPWWVQVEEPDAAPPTHAPTVPAPAALRPTRIALHGLSVATSGDYRRYFVDATGTRQSHTIDPRSGRPVGHGLASVSVLHPECMWADAWSTALMVLGPEHGPALAARLDIAALFMHRRQDGGVDEVLSPAFEELAA